ncbi:hypothetical protein Tco_0066839, partial [Tanacetum coccineum]
CGVNLLLGTCLNCTYGDGKSVTCCGCEGSLKGGFCSFCASRDGNSFDYNPNPNSFNESQNFSDYPPQPQYETNICELCGNDAHYDYDCSPQVPFVYNKNPCFDQNFDNNFPPTLPSFPQQYLCCENCGGPHATFQCQPMNQNLSISNSFSFDQFQPLQYPVIHHSPQETSEKVLQAREDLMKAIQTFLRKFSRIPFGEIPKVLLVAWERFSEIKHAFTDKQYQQEDIQELMSKILEDVRNINEELFEFIKSPSWNRPTFNNDDDEYTIIYRKHKEITPDLSTAEPDNSLSMRDEHLNTIPKIEKSSVENLVPIPSEFKGISEDICDMSSCDHFDAECGLINSLLSRDIPITSPKIDFLPEEFVEDADTFLVTEDSIPPGIESDLDSEGVTVFLDNLLNDDPILEYERFTFDIEPDAPVINNFDELNEDECFDPGGGDIDVSQNIEDDDSFAFVIRTFLPYRTYLVDSPLLLSTRSDDTLFDPGIST